MPFFTTHFGNPSSSHHYGTAPRNAILQARQSILSLLHPTAYRSKNINHATLLPLNITEKSIIFTGCGTEADHLAIHLALQDSSHRDRLHKHIVTSNVEHPAVEQYLAHLQHQNYHNDSSNHNHDSSISVTYVPVNEDGYVCAKDMINAITADTVLVTLMLANNESGSLQPVKEVSAYCRQRGILFHTDAAQAVGKVSISMEEEEEEDGQGVGSNVDMMTIVGHKFGAPKGIACLYIHPSCLESFQISSSRFCGMLLGGGQEYGMRAGTENVPYIVGLGKSASLLMEVNTCYKKEQWKVNAERMEGLRSRLLQNFISELGMDMVRVNGPSDPKLRLPNTLSVGFKDIQSSILLQKVGDRVACSAGSACHSSGTAISSILVAMSVPLEFARGTLRLSIGPSTTEDEVDRATSIIVEEVRRQWSV